MDTFLAWIQGIVIMTWKHQKCRHECDMTLTQQRQLKHQKSGLDPIASSDDVLCLLNLSIRRCNKTVMISKLLWA